MKRGGAIGRILVLLVLIIVLVLGGLLWFDYLGLVNTRSFFTPVYSLFGLQAPAGVTQNTGKGKLGNIDEDRYAKRLLALERYKQELDKTKAENETLSKENARIAQALDEREAAVEEKELAYHQRLIEANSREENIQQIAQYLINMPPENAVPNLLEMDDQDVIDVLRAAEGIAKKTNKGSMVAYWFSLMPPARAAEIQRKMANKPVTIP